MSKQKPFGRCALCGKESELTFEHIPPRAAFNNTPAKMINGETLLQKGNRHPWDLEGLPYSNRQRGFGNYTLCASCNNNTGAWYADAYISIAQVAIKVLLEDLAPDKNTLVIQNTYPLRFIKQIVSMFCSVNSNMPIDDLRQFVLDKNATGIDRNKYKLHMYFTKEAKTRAIPYSVKGLLGNDTGLCQGLSEITVPPLGFIMYFDPVDEWSFDGFDITHFAECKYDDLAEMRLPLCVYKVNSLFPTDYCSKEEMIQRIEKNEKWKKEHETDDEI